MARHPASHHGAPPLSKPSSDQELMPLGPGDFYLDEQGLMVFTRQYHLRRGFCCKSGCLHCPWGYRKKKRSTELPPDFEIVVRNTSDD